LRYLRKNQLLLKEGLAAPDYQFRSGGVRVYRLEMWRKEFFQRSQKWWRQGFYIFLTEGAGEYVCMYGWMDGYDEVRCGPGRVPGHHHHYK
jgi:hypothetical protein